MAQDFKDLTKAFYAFYHAQPFWFVFSIVRKLDGIVVKRYEHPANVYGCDWNPKNK